MRRRNRRTRGDRRSTRACSSRAARSRCVGLAVLGVVPVDGARTPPRASRRPRAAACARRAAANPALCPTGSRARCRSPAPDFTAYDHNGKPVKLSDFRGKVVLLNFWASWCGVCKTEKPQLEAMADELASDDFVVIALASDRTWSDVLRRDRRRARRRRVKRARRRRGSHARRRRSTPTSRRCPSGVAVPGVPRSARRRRQHRRRSPRRGASRRCPRSALIDRKGNIRAYFVNKRDWESPVAETCLRSVIDE